MVRGVFLLVCRSYLAWRKGQIGFREVARQTVLTFQESLKALSGLRVICTLNSPEQLIIEARKIDHRD